MILDTLDNWKLYVGMNPGCDKAFEFLMRDDLADLAAGRHEIDGEKVFAIVVKDQGKGRDGAKLEAHRNYTDIQYCVSGLEEMGWKPTTQCAADEGFDEANKAWMELMTEESEIDVKPLAVDELVANGAEFTPNSLGLLMFVGLLEDKEA